MSLTHVVLSRQFDDVRSVLMALSRAHLLLTIWCYNVSILVLNCLKNSLNVMSCDHMDGISRSCGWDDGVRKFRTAFRLWKSFSFGR